MILFTLVGKWNFLCCLLRTTTVCKIQSTNLHVNTYILSNRLKYIWLYYGWTLTCVCSTLEHSNTCNTCFWHWQEIFAKLLLDCHRTWIRSNWGFNQESRNRRIDFDQRRSTRFQSDKAILLRNGTSELHAYNSVPKSFELSYLARLRSELMHLNESWPLQT